MAAGRPGTAHVVHGDYTLTSAPQRLRDMARPPTANDTYCTALAEGETLLVEAGRERLIRVGETAVAVRLA